jgi:hypothetical protein
MLTQIINLLVSARPNLGGQGAGSVSGGGGGGTTGGVGEDKCAGRGDDAQDGRRQGREEDGAAAAEAGENSTAAAEPLRPGRTRQLGEEAAHVPGADGGRPAVWRGARVSADFGRPAAAENPVGQRTGGAAEVAVG